MTRRSTVNRQLLRAIGFAAMTCRWVGIAERPRRRAVALAMILGVALSGLISPDLQTFGSREALAAGPGVDHLRYAGQFDGYASANSCDKDQYFQEAFSWNDFMSYLSGTRPSYKSISRIGYCIEKPRTTRPGVAGGNRWDYWDDYWARERHKNDSIWQAAWWRW